MTAPARARRTGPRRQASTAPPAVSPYGADGDPDNLAADPFVRRIAAPGQAERMQASRRDIIEGLKVLEDQRDKALLADDMYDGDVGMIYASRQVKRLLARQGLDESEIDDFNYAKIPVDVIADRLQIAAVKVAPRVTEEEEDAEGDDATGDAPEGDGTAGASAGRKLVKRAERAVKALRRANRLDVHEKELHHNVSKHGDAFLFVWPVQDDRGKVVSIDMRVHTAHTVAFIYDEEDPLEVAYVIKSWETPSDIDDETGEGQRMVIRVNLYYPGERTVDADGEIGQAQGRIERWVTKVGATPGRADSWVKLHAPAARQDIEPDDFEEVAADEFGDPDDPLDKDDIPSPFGLTWFHFRNGVQYGKPEHRSAYGPQKLINKLIWTFAGTVESQGFSQRYIMVDPKIDDPLHNVIDPDHPEDDDDPEGDGSSGLSADPGTVWRLYGKSTGEYAAANPDTLLKPLDRFITAMSELTGLPRYAFTKASADMPSGEALREMNAGTNAKIIDRQDRYDPDWQDAYELALRMLGITGIAVDVRWVPVNQVNDMNGLQVLREKAALGVPSEVLLNEAGYPDELIEQWLKRQEGLSLEQRIALLGQLGTAVQALAAGVTAGVVPENVMQAFTNRILGNLADGTTDAPKTKDSLPDPEFRDPPPTDPAAAQAKAAQDFPGPHADLDRAQKEIAVEHARVQVEGAKAGIEATRAGVDSTKASTDATRAGTEMMKKGGGPQQVAKKTAPRKAGGR